MLKIINDLRPFFENCYARINIRQYARFMKITPPTASALLKYYEKEGLLVREKDRNYIMFYANKSNPVFIVLSRLYWRHTLEGMLDFLTKKLANPTIILFGSLSKAETKPDSDIDIAIICDEPEIDLSQFRKKLGREIQNFWFKSLKDGKNKDLINNIINGYVMAGTMKL